MFNKNYSCEEVSCFFNVKIQKLQQIVQCDQIGRFLKVLMNKVPCKCSPKIKQLFWAIVKNGTF